MRRLLVHQGIACSLLYLRIQHYAHLVNLLLPNYLPTLKQAMAVAWNNLGRAFETSGAWLDAI